MRMVRNIFLILGLILFLVPGFGKAVTKAEVASAVNELLEEWNRTSDAEIVKMDPHYLADGSLAFYMVDLGPGGWVLVSGDDVLRPVLAFSFENNMIPLDQWADAASYLLNTYKNEIGSALKNKDLRRDVRWDRLQFATSKGTSEDIYIDPLIDVTWDQGSGWNMFCPSDEEGPGGHAYVGCVAVAMSQAMSVYEYPASPKGIKSYVHDTYGSISVNYNMSDPYEWSQMSSSSYDSYNALLLYHCAVAVEMDFGADGSGAYVRTAANAMKDFFSYSKNLSFSMRFEDEEQWKSLLVGELEAGRPIVYRGGPDDGRSGHAWNIDGYGNGYFHMNFGWSGSQNGYFTLDLINPGNNDFSSSQGAMIGISPPLSAPTDLSLSANYVNEGSPVGSYVADVIVEDEDPDNIYSFECTGKFSIILDDYLPAAFNIVEGKLLTEKIFTYDEARPERNTEFLRILVEDQYGNKFKKEFLIDIRKAYHGPTGIALSDSSVKELQPIGTAVACLMVEDEDDTNSYTFELKGPFNASVSDYDVPLFYLDEDTLRTDVIFDLHESDTAYVLIELEDKYGFRMSRAFTIQIKRDQSGSTGFTRISLENDLVFPNPAVEYINLRDTEQISLFEIYEISSGRLVMREDLPTDRTDVSGLPEGVYLVVIRSDGEMHAQKLLISR
ncbi:MAG: C10 family peptidase [Bacteroidales bacterium]